VVEHVDVDALVAVIVADVEERPVAAWLGLARPGGAEVAGGDQVAVGFRDEAAEGGVVLRAPLVGGSQAFGCDVEVRFVLGVVDARDGRVVVRSGGADE